jgi:hypothetical protein
MVSITANEKNYLEIIAIIGLFLIFVPIIAMLLDLVSSILLHYKSTGLNTYDMFLMTGLAMLIYAAYNKIKQR